MRAGIVICFALAPLLSGLSVSCEDITVPIVDRLSSAVSDGGVPAAEAGARGSGPFLAPTAIAALASPSDSEDPTFTADETELYFESNRGSTGQHIWVSRRTQKTDGWGTPQRVAELSSTANDRGPSVSVDGLTIWFDSNRNVGTSYDIFVSSRASRADAWGTPQYVAELSSAAQDASPSINETELAIVFMSDRPGGVGGLDIYESTRASTTDRWGVPFDVTEVNTPGDEWDPFIGDGDLELYWAANKPNEEIRMAARASVTGRFGPYTRMPELGIPSFDPNVSSDLHHIIFGFRVAGTPQIYEAFR